MVALVVILIWPPVLVLVVLASPLTLSHFAAQYPDSWFARVATFLAVVSAFIVGGAVLVFVFERFGTLSFQNQSILFLLALYAASFALCEAIAREQRIKHWKLGELKGEGWVRRFKEITPDTDNNILQALYEDGVALMDEFGPYTHPDFKKDLEVLAGLLKPDQ